MKRKITLIFSLFGIGFLLFNWTGYSAVSTLDSRPNIILLMVDTLRADKLGIYGEKPPTSPEIDRIGAEGVVFEHAISQASWTRPSVASILTSLYPRKLGVMKEEWDVLGDQATTLAEALHENGYMTVGLTANPQLNTVFGFSQGFDQYADSTVIFSWMKDEQGKKKAGKTARVKMSDELLEEALARLRQPRSKPIYLQLMLMDVHAHGRIKEAAIETPFRDSEDGKYLQAVRQVSRQIGKFVEALEHQPELNMRNTILIITSDHGEGLHDHPAVKNSHGHGNLLYRSQIHVPLIFYGTGGSRLTPGRRKGVIELIDVFPTVLALADIELSSDVDGQSQKQTLLFDTPLAVTRVAFSETRWHTNVEKSAVVNAEWMYIESRDQWPGCAAKELQPLLGEQDGLRTEVSGQHPDVFAVMQKSLNDQEQILNAAGSAISAGTPAVSSRELKQLKSLGYLGK